MTFLRDMQRFFVKNPQVAAAFVILGIQVICAIAGKPLKERLDVCIPCIHSETCPFFNIRYIAKKKR